MSLKQNMMANHLAEYYGEKAPPWDVLIRAADAVLDVIEEWQRSAPNDGLDAPGTMEP
jgi:hypothetical protein